MAKATEGQCYHCGQNRLVTLTHKQGGLKIYACTKCAKKYGPDKRFNNRMEEVVYNAACEAIGQVS